ncbi:MAG: S-layer homology domain-containing protein [bacterium]
METDSGCTMTLTVQRSEPRGDGGLRGTLFAWPARLLSFGLVALLTLFLAGGSAEAFTDVPPDRLDYRAITGLSLKGAVDGFPDGAFRPDSPALRAEFVKMVTSAMFLTPTDPNQAPFGDLDPDGVGARYPGSYIAAAYVAGIVEGKTSAVFDPYGPLTRAQAMTIVVRTAAKLRAREFKPLPADYRGRFADFSDPTHGQSAKLAEANHLLAGIDLSRWDPWATATRSEAATIVWNLVGCFG